MPSGRSSSCRGEGAAASADLTSARRQENNSLPVVTAGHLSLNTEASQAGVCMQLVPASDLTARKTGFEHPLLTPPPCCFQPGTLTGS